MLFKRLIALRQLQRFHIVAAAPQTLPDVCAFLAHAAWNGLAMVACIDARACDGRQAALRLAHLVGFEGWGACVSYILQIRSASLS